MDERIRSRLLAAHAARPTLTRRLARQYGGDAEDYVAEAVLRCATAQLDDEQALPAWLTRTAERLALNDVRARRTAIKYRARLAEPAADASADELLLDDELRAEVATAVSRLSEARRQVLLAANEGATYEAIARTLNKSPNTVRNLLINAREDLRRHLRKTGQMLGLLLARPRRRLRDPRVGQLALSAVESGPLIVAGATSFFLTIVPSLASFVTGPDATPASVVTVLSWSSDFRDSAPPPFAPTHRADARNESGTGNGPNVSLLHEARDANVKDRNPSIPIMGRNLGLRSDAPSGKSYSSPDGNDPVSDPEQAISDFSRDTQACIRNGLNVSSTEITCEKPPR